MSTHVRGSKGLTGEEYLLIDGNNLVYRVFFALPHLSKGQSPTYIPFGIFRVLISTMVLVEKPLRPVFFWDSQNSSRRLFHPSYKSRRRKDPDKEVDEELERMFRQMGQFKQDLGKMNFPGFEFDGLEADDLIARFILDRPQTVPCLILSADQDLFQLLQPGVDVWDFKRKCRFTAADFRNKYGIDSKQWPLFRAITGDKTDDLVGVPGVGEVRALRYMEVTKSGERRTDADKRICEKVEYCNDLVERNLRLMRLPFAGTPHIPFPLPEPSREQFIDYCIQQGFSQIMRSPHWTRLFGGSGNEAER